VPPKGFKRRKGGNLSLDEIKKRILIKLFEEREGLNQNQIRAIPTLNAVEWNALGAVLAELCIVGKLNADPTDEYKKGAWKFSITEEGREFIETLKKMKGIGAGFSFFNPNE